MQEPEFELVELTDEELAAIVGGVMVKSAL